jgi:hypothetical protein
MSNRAKASAGSLGGQAVIRVGLVPLVTGWLAAASQTGILLDGNLSMVGASAWTSSSQLRTPSATEGSVVTLWA